MKVRVEFAIDIDKETWMSEFGVPSDEVRRDVQTYAASICYREFQYQGLIRDEEEI